MAHFIINLPGNIPADVRRGKVFNKRAGFFKQWPWIKISKEESTGYIVMVNAATGEERSQYHLIRTREGRWARPMEHELNLAINKKRKWEPVEEDEITLFIKKAIDEYENKQ